MQLYDLKTGKNHTKTCKMCGSTSDNFYPGRRLCKPCYLKRNRDYVNTPGGSANAKAAKARYKRTVKGRTSNTASNKNRHLRNKKLIELGINAAVYGHIPPTKFVRNLGCSWDEFRQIIDDNRNVDMTAENYQISWFIKPIMPLTYFNLKSPKQFAQACHHSNFVVCRAYERPWARPTPLNRNTITPMDPVEMDNLNTESYYNIFSDTFPDLD